MGVDLSTFEHHPPPDDATVFAHQSARHAVARCAVALMSVVPEGRHQELMVEHLEDALMRANKAIATQGPRPRPTDPESTG